MNMVTVKINGIEYNLKGEEREEYLHKIASYVDKKLRSIMGNNPKLSTTSSAVLAAINSVDDLFKAQRAYEELRDKISHMENEDKSSSKQLEALKEEVKRLKNNNDELIARLSEDEKEKQLRQRDEEIQALRSELEEARMTIERYANDCKSFDAEKKELKFQLQSARYKVINLQNKLVESQINLAKYRKLKDPLINEEEN